MRRYRKLLMGMAMVLLVMGITSVSMAAENNKGNGEVVFLLDTSGSMNTQDKDRGAIDAIRQAVYSLPTGYQAGLVAYNAKIQTVIPLGTDPEQMETRLSTIKYSGYTNAGEGLNQAIALFSDQNGVNRSVIMVTDGEIDMPNKQEKEQSRALYNDAAARARDKGVKMYIVAVGNELESPQQHIFDGAEVTDGAIYWEGQSGTLPQIIERILTERLGIPRQPLGVTDAGGGTVHAELPEGVSCVKLLLTSDRNLKDVTADYKADSGRTITGSHFAVIDMKRPVPGGVDVQFQTSDISGVKASLLTEYTIEPSITVGYRTEPLPQTEEEKKKQTPPRYQHFADVSIALLDSGGNHQTVFSGTPFEGMELPFQLNGVSYTGVLHNGILSQTISADGIDSVEATVDLSSLAAVCYVKHPTPAAIPKIPDPEFKPAPDYRPLWILMAILAAAIAGIIIWWAKKKKTTVIYVEQPPAAGEPMKKMETKACTYSGKLNLYVVKTGDGRDVPPQTYRLFGRQSGRMTLDQILTSCGIKFGKIGAADITIYPGPDHSIIIMDQSERCTVLRGTEILKKGMGYPAYYNEKLTVAFEDEATEMEIHYKNLKPSEREG